MRTDDSIRDSYDSAAEAYAEHLAHELERKPLDRHLLNRFAEEVHGRGRVADLGCGPGHISQYLHDRGVPVIGIDLAPGMIRVARRLYPEIEFRTGDMAALEFEDASLAGIIAFYSIVHFGPAGLDAVFRELRRVLMPGGLVLIAFHIGDQIVHRDDLFGAPVSLDFQFHQPRHVVQTLARAQLRVMESVEREPYEGAEHPSRRCYLLAAAPGA